MYLQQVMGHLLWHNNLIYNPGNNIFELWNALIQVEFVTSKMKFDI